MKQTLRKKILQYLTGRDWVNGGEIEARAMEWGYKGSTASRLCRRMTKWTLDRPPLLERKIEQGSVFYRLLPISEPEPVKMSFGQLQMV